jgi:hypothetical protein
MYYLFVVHEYCLFVVYILSSMCYFLAATILGWHLLVSRRLWVVLLLVMETLSLVRRH